MYEIKNVFNALVSNSIIERINKLSPETQAKWGKMDAAKMLAHCNVTYEMAFEDIHKKPNALMRFILKTFVKNSVVGANAYKKNLNTAPEFIIKSDKIFENEKVRLINYITKTQKLGEKEFEGRESHSFGFLSAKEWNNMFYKHLDHHLTQFGV